jgi:transposase-like protein
MDKKQAVQIVHDRTIKQLSYRSLAKKYGVARSTLHRMINSKQEAAFPEDESLPDDVKALKEALRKERLKNELLNTVIDIASKELGIDIRKKSGTRQSE